MRNSAPVNHDDRAWCGRRRAGAGARSALWVAAMLAVPSAAEAYEGGTVSGGGTISGTVRFVGKIPPKKAVKITKDAAFCGDKNIQFEDLLVSPSKGLENVVVFIAKIKKGKPMSAGTARLVNENCRYEPHVIALPVGTKLFVENRDPILHNTHARVNKKVDAFNFGLPKQGQVLETVLTQKALVKVGCDAGHEWMAAYLAVFDNPYFAVSNAEGKFEMSDVPPGKYKLAFWHEMLGRKTKTVQVLGEKTADASFDFK